MHVHRIMLLGLLALLGACKEERLVLHFEQPVTSSWGIDAAYEHAILDGLKNAGIDSSQAALSTRDSGKVVAVSFPEDALSQQQQASLITYFNDVLDARTEAQQVRLQIKQQSLEQAEGSPLFDATHILQEKANKMRPLFTSRISYFDTPSLTYLDQEKSGKSLYSRVRCEVTLVLENTLPQIDYYPNFLGESNRTNRVNQLLEELVSFRLPSSMTIGRSDLNHAVTEGHYEYRLITSPNTRNKQADKLVFFFGELGDVAHFYGTTTTDLGEFESACMDRVIAAGRPFTFHYGHSLDRLVAVEYLFGEQTN